MSAITLPLANRAQIERTVIENIKSNPDDIVNRLQRLNTTTRADILLSEVEAAISEIVSLRCQLRERT